MEKIQIPKIKILLPLFFISLLFLTPFLSTTMRSSYILNLLIVFLGLEAGFLSSAASKSSDESIKRNIFNTIGFGATYITISQGNTTDASVLQPQIVLIKQIPNQEMAKEEAIIKSCNSRPSIFFIGNGNDHELEIDSAGMNEAVIIVKETEDNIIIPTMKRTGKVEKIISKHELHIMTEAFIGNFYKQLKVDAELEILAKVA